MTELKQPNFLQNTPEGADLFAGQSQEKIADVLSRIITKEKFQVLGIEGGWGTGKSNLVKILQAKLNSHTFFIYDVWGHQEDDQRRAILAGLTELISDESLKLVLDKKKWKGKLEGLLSKRKVTTTTNMPYLSIGFIFSLFLVIYVPSVNALKDVDGSLLGIENTVLKLLLVLFPLVILLFIYIYYVIGLLKISDFKQSLRLALQKIFQVYQNKQEQDTKLETISENEPSVKEFCSWMKEIDKDLVDKKLILVFDNFDRLPKKHIQSVWSSVHIFFAEEQYKNIKVIIPFDRSHLKNVFSELDDKSNKNDFANDYVNKTFDMVYRISQPILSDWKSFFKTKWNSAFSEADESEFVKVLQIYETYRPIITPREIINFINQTVALYLLDDQIPLRYVALYIIHQEEILKDPLKAVTQPEYLKGLNYLYGNDESLQKYITALAYQISAENALEVAFRRQLKDSLLNNVPAELNEVGKTRVFQEILGPVIDELENFDNCILALDKLAEDALISETIREQIWSRIYNKKLVTTVEDMIISTADKVLLQYINVNARKQYSKKMIGGLLGSDQFESGRFIDFIDDLHKWDVAKDLDVDMFNVLAGFTGKEVPADQFIEVLLASKGEQYKRYQIVVDVDDLNEYLSSLDIASLGSVKNLTAIRDEYSLEKFSQDLKVMIEANKGIYKNLEVLFDLLKDVKQRKVDQTITDTDLASLFTTIPSIENFYAEVIAMRLARGSAFSDIYGYITTILTSTDVELTRKVAGKIEYYEDFDNLFLNSLKFPDSVLYQNVLAELVTNSPGTSRANISVLLEHYKEILDSNVFDSTAFLTRLSRWDASGIDTKSVGIFPNELFEHSKKVNNTLTNKLLEIAKMHLEKLEKDDWISAFHDFNSKNCLLSEIIDFVGWTSSAREALHEVFLSDIENKQVQDTEYWKHLFSSFANAEQDVVSIYSDARDKILKDKSLVDEKLFVLLLGPFLNFGLLGDEGNSAFRTFFKAEFLDDNELVSHFAANAAEIKKLMKTSNQNEVSTFKQAIRDRSEKSEIVLDLMKQLDIRPNKTEKKE